MELQRQERINKWYNIVKASQHNVLNHKEPTITPSQVESILKECFEENIIDGEFILTQITQDLDKRLQEEKTEFQRLRDKAEKLHDQSQLL